MLRNLIFLIVFGGFLFIGLLLATGREGFAVKFANYFYVALLSVVFWGLVKK